MTYQYKSSVRAADFFRMSMRQTYHSVAGMCNVVFTVAMILLTVKLWERSGDLVQVLLLFACLLFPVFQPIGIYFRAKAQARTLPEDMELGFDDEGLHVRVGGQKEDIPWKRIRVVKQPDMIIVFSDAKHGYMLTNRVMGKEKEEFFAFAEEKIAVLRR